MQILKSIKNSFSTISHYTAGLIIGSMVALMPSKKSHAQNQPIYNQFFLTPFIYNPAYAGKNPNSMAYLNYRQQWTGIDGAPVSYTFMFDTQFKKGLSFGIIAQNDTRGIISTSSGQFTIGYGVKFNKKQGLRFGLSAGAGTNNLNINDGFTDAAVQNALKNNFFLSARAGFNYYYENINLSFSIPDIFKRKLISTSDFTPIEIDPFSNYMVMASAKIKLVPQTLVFEPHVLYRTTPSRINQIEAVGVFDIKELVWIGASYRQHYGITGLAGFKVKNYITLGYGYEIPTAELSGISSATHEIQLSIRLGKDKVKEAEEKKIRIEAKREKQRMAKEAARKKRAEEKALQEEMERQEIEEKNRLAREAEQQERQRQEKQRQETERQETERQERQRQERQRQEIEQKNRAATEAEQQPKKEAQQLPQTQQSKKQQILVTDTKEAPIVLIKGDSEDELQEDHYVVVGSYDTKEHAEKYADKLRKQGHNAGYGYSGEKQHYYVYIFKSSSAEETLNQRDKYRKMSLFEDAWHLEIQGEGIQESAESNSLNDSPINDRPRVVVKKGDHMLELNLGHYVIIGSFSNFDNATNYSEKVFSMGHQNSFGYSSEKQLYYVYIHKGNTSDETRKRRNEFRKLPAFKDAWYLLVEE